VSFFSQSLIDTPGKVPEATSGFISGDDTHTNLITHQDEMTRGIIQTLEEGLYFRTSLFLYPVLI
jgi:hypothetical protein